MIKIAVSGLANTGKNTIGKIIVKQMRIVEPKLTASFLAFADPIKKMAHIMFPNLPKKYFYGPSKFRNEIIPGAFKDENPLTVREVLLDIGTKLGRGYKSNIWIDNFAARLNKHSKKDVVGVYDVRFREEFDYLKEEDFFKIRVYRNNSSSINHISETGQAAILDSEFDYIIHNNGS